MTFNKTTTHTLKDNSEVDVYYTIDVPRSCTTEDEIEIEYEYDDAGLTEQQILELEDIIGEAIKLHKIDIIED